MSPPARRPFSILLDLLESQATTGLQAARQVVEKKIRESVPLDQYERQRARQVIRGLAQAQNLILDLLHEEDEPRPPPHHGVAFPRKRTNGGI